nr:phosphoadenosine phosphosulfate reductase [Sphingobium sp.]
MADPARRIDVIDARPAFTQADADALNARFEGVDALTMLKAI